MNTDSTNLTFDTILTKGKFIIPDYQREYDWEDKEIVEFWEDLQEIKNNENYFIGHMVFEGELNGREFKVIDGQQRITTITIILCVIRDLLYKLDENKLANVINNQYIFGEDKNGDKYPRLENKCPYPIFQARVQSKPSEKNNEIEAKKEGEKKILKSYDKFNSLLKKFTKDELVTLRDKILNLEAIFVAVSIESDAFTIFETLNAKGKDLTPLDLIKNQIFKNYPTQPHIDEPNDSWKILLENVSGSDKFLNNFWASRYKKVADRKIYKEFLKEIIKEKEENLGNQTKLSIKVNNFLESLLLDSTYFKLIKNPLKENWDKKGDFQIYFYLEGLNIYKIDVANAFILSLIREYKEGNISQKYIIKALKNIEKFHFINNAICSERSSGLDTKYSLFSKQMFDADGRQNKHIIIDKLILYLDERKPDFEIFELNFFNKLIYSSKDSKYKKLVRHNLEKIEYIEQDFSLVLNDMSIEHIEPESSKKNKSLIKNLGNLCLLESNLNSKLNDKSYSEKKKIILNGTILKSTKNIFESNKTWDKIQIESRNRELLNFLYNN